MRRMLAVVLLVFLALPLMGSRRATNSPAVVRSPSDPAPPPSMSPGVDTLVLADYSFDDGQGGPDAQGWTSVDMSLQPDTFFHVDDFAGLPAPYAALEGTQSLWCGVRPNHAGLCTYATPPGYGNSWRQFFESVAFPVSGDVTVTFLERHDSEQGFDYTFVEYESKTGRWQMLAAISGTGETIATYVIPADSLLGTARIRFRFESEIIYSDEDGLWDTNGAIVIDSLTVEDGGGFVDFQDFEAEAPGAFTTADGDWYAFVAPALGDYAGLFDGGTVLQEDPLVSNDTYLWGFFNGSPYDYACAGHPEQVVVPYPNGDSQIFNRVYSPPIYLDASVPPDTLLFEYDAYVAPASNGVSYSATAHRFLVNDQWQCWEQWRSAWTGFRWARTSRPIVVPPYASAIQIAVDVEESFLNDACRGQAPLYDNIRIIALGHYDLLVTNTADAGPGSLRQAILDSNASPYVEIVAFAIPGPGPHIIQPVTPLPVITDHVVINGYTQDGAAINTLDYWTGSNAVIKIELDGALAPPGTSGLVLESSAVVHGLAIGNFPDAGVRVQADGCMILGNYIGTDATGTSPAPNGVGVRVESGYFGGYIGGSRGDRNIISANLGAGVELAGSYRVNGNFIGTDPSGEVALVNQGVAVLVTGGTDVRIGDEYGGSTNRIAYGDPGGVVVTGAATLCRIMNNWIWTESSTAPGIDLGGDGVTPNDAGDSDSGPNLKLNYPELTYVATSNGGSQTQIDGQIVGAVPESRTYQIQFFASPDGSPRQGKQTMNMSPPTEVTTDAGGNASFSFTIIGYNPPDGGWVTSTLTYNGYTSEFSSPFQIANTQAGSNIGVEVTDPASGFAAYIEFDSVVVGGVTTMSSTSSGPEPPPAFGINDPATYFEIFTDVSYTDSITVCLEYDEAALQGLESEVRLLHYDTLLTPPDWVDITRDRYPVENFVCGRTAHLSPFIVGVMVATGIRDVPGVPAAFALHPNVPNPFNPTTTIAFDVPEGAGRVTIAVYDVSGRLVRTLVDGELPPGFRQVSWDGHNRHGRPVASGVYFCRYVADGFRETMKMVLLK